MAELALSLLIAGTATYYNPAWTAEVLANRIAWGQVEPCRECIGYVALLEPEHIGRKVWLQRVGQEPEGPFLVYDCGPQDPAKKAALIERGWAVDVDYQTAQRWQMRGPIWVRVLTEG